MNTINKIVLVCLVALFGHNVHSAHYVYMNGKTVSIGLVYGGIVEGKHKCTLAARVNGYHFTVKGKENLVSKRPTKSRDCSNQKGINDLAKSAYLVSLEQGY